MVADMANWVAGDDGTLVVGEVGFGAGSRASVVGKMFLFTGGGGGTFVFFEMFFFALGADMIAQVFFVARRCGRTYVFIQVRTSAWSVAVGARESLKDLTLIFLCAAYLWCNVSILYELAGSVKAEA